MNGCCADRLGVIENHDVVQGAGHSSYVTRQKKPVNERVITACRVLEIELKLNATWCEKLDD